MTCNSWSPQQLTKFTRGFQSSSIKPSSLISGMMSAGRPVAKRGEAKVRRFKKLRSLVKEKVAYQLYQIYRHTYLYLHIYRRGLKT